MKESILDYIFEYELLGEFLIKNISYYSVPDLF